MRRLIWWSALLGVVGMLSWGASVLAANYLKGRKVTYREAEVTRGQIVAVVNSTGTIKPVRSVLVGAFVSGPIKAIYVDFNSTVKKGQLLAKIDPLLYEANAARDRAMLATKKAEVKRAEWQLQQAENDKGRAEKLRSENKTFISEAELDQFRFNHLVMKAQLDVAKTSEDQAKANLDNSEANLGYTNILAPEDGVIIDRKIDPGQTVAATFQTPDLFVVAPDMEKEMLVFASVDEADIGLIQDAMQTGQPVQFTVDAYPDLLFQGKISQIRKSSTTTQNVVTYPVIVSAENADLKLYPGMTASISFQLRKKERVLRVPNAALRFFPQRDQVRPEDYKLLENKTPTAGEMAEQTDKMRSAEEKSELRKNRHRRHVWVVDGDFLRAVEVVTGLSDNTYTEVISGDLKEGDKIVTGVQAKT